MKHTITLIPGDGIGPEIVAATVRVIEATGVDIDWEHPVPYEGDTWLEVEGMVIDPSGREGARRQVLVRAGRLPLRPPRRRTRLRP